MFDPNQYADESPRKYETIPAGEYLLAIAYLERKQGRNGPYLRARYEIIDGQRAGQTFFSNIGINVAESRGSAGRLAVFCRCIGQQSPFDLDDDRSVNRAFVGRPFKARVSLKQNGQWTNNDIERYLPELTDEERRIADGWVLDRQESQAMGDEPSYEDEPDDMPF